MTKNFVSLLAATATLTASAALQAGTIYTDRASFLAAVNDPLVAAEDFESFTIGFVSSPFSIMGGSALIFGENPSIVSAPEIIDSMPSSNNVWVGSITNSGIPTFIDAMGGSGFTAFGIDYGLTVSGIWGFAHSQGSDTNAAVTNELLPPNNFIGWVGSGTEILASVNYVPSSPGDVIGNIVFDEILGFAPVPIPAAFWLFGSGLFGLISVARRTVND